MNSRVMLAVEELREGEEEVERSRRGRERETERKEEWGEKTDTTLEVLSRSSHERPSERCSFISAGIEVCAMRNEVRNDGGRSRPIRCAKGDSPRPRRRACSLIRQEGEGSFCGKTNNFYPSCAAFVLSVRANFKKHQ